MLYQLSYTREPCAFLPACTHEVRPETNVPWWGKDSNLRRRYAGRFTVCSRWPLGYPTAFAPTPANTGNPPGRDTPRDFARASLVT